VGFLLGLGVLVGWLRSHGGVDEGTSGVQRVAVLPFENLGDSGDRYFADGVADEVRGKLAALPGVEVIARASSAQYRQTSKPPQQVARELGVRYLLTGTVRWEKQPGADGRVRVSPELVDAARGTTRWQQPFDAPVADVFAVQADIAGRVAQALGVALGAGQRERMARRPTRNLDAYQHYLRGRELAGSENTTEPLRAAAAEFRAAVELDTAFADAWAALGSTHAALFRFGGVQASDTRLAGEAVEHARALAPESPETRLAAASYAGLVTGDIQAALREVRAGLEVAPGRADLLAFAGSIEQELGQAAEGLADLEHAARLDPRAPSVLASLAVAYLNLHRLPEAEGAITRARALKPTSLSLAYQQARIVAGKGDLEGVRGVLSAMEPSQGARRVDAYVAIREDLISVLDSTRLRRMLTLTPADLDNGRADWALALAEGNWLLGNRRAARAYGDTAVTEYTTQTRALGANLSPRDRAMQVGLQALALAYAGRAAEAAAEARRAAEDPAGDAYVHHLAARAYLLAGQPEPALHQLEIIASGRLPGYYSRAALRMDPAFAALDSQPRFQQLLRDP
jgi:TolB-like protein/Flp pilus assembly protein TadD